MRHTYSYTKEYESYIRDGEYYFTVFYSDYGPYTSGEWRRSSGSLLDLPQVSVPNTLLVLQGVPL